MTCKDRLEEYRRDNGVPFQMQHHARVFTAQGGRRRAHPGQAVGQGGHGCR